ncbi:MAG: hypothetical protein R2754_07200 [Microthrixaceae bacterium]
MLRRQKRTHDPVWDGADSDRVRVLLECEADSTPSLIASVIEQEGYEVRTCCGPEDVGCSLVDHGVCELVEGADVVVNMLRPHEGGAAVLDRTLARRRPPAVVVEQSPHQSRTTEPGGADTPGIDTDRVVVAHTPVTRNKLVGAIRAALDQRHAAATARGR